MKNIDEIEKDLISIYNDILKDTVEHNDTNYKYENGISKESEEKLNSFVNKIYSA